MIKRKEFMLGAVAGLTLAAAATAGGVIDWPTAEAQVSGVSGRIVPSAGLAGAAFAPPQGAPRSFADIFEQVAPAVVQIDVEARVPGGQRGVIQIPGLPPFGIPIPEGQGEGEDGEGATTLGAGSGFFISGDGYIVTNNHVVADAVEIKVRLADERELEARVIGRDPATDLAVIKVEGADFPFVQFEEQAAPRVGDWVIAVGNPFGLGGTATAGIVSGLSRQAGQFDRRDAGYVDFLQIDAAINRGNSGGPTFDIYGRVIGVNSAILSPTGASAGIGFAIPASLAKTVTDQLIQGGSVTRGFVGLTLLTPSAEAWESYGMPRDFDGAFVEGVTPDGPADRAGLREGDIIVSVNGEPVENSTEATRIVGAARPDSNVRFEIDRDGRRQTISVRAGTRPSEEELNAQQNGSSPGGAPGGAQTEGVSAEGITVNTLTPAMRQRMRLPDGGVLIASVEQGSRAARAGLEPGLLILRVNRTSVDTAESFSEAVQAAKAARRPSVALSVQQPSTGQRGIIVVPFEAD